MDKKREKRIEEYLNILQEEPALYQVANKLVKDTNIEFGQKIYHVVFAPVLVCFVEWVLREAKKKGIKRLYFLARDGYQMYLAAEQLCKSRKYDIECWYLYGSRYAWRMAEFALVGEACLDMICLGGIDVTFEKIMKRGGLTEEECLIVAKELGFMKNYKKILSYSQVQQLKKPLKESKNFLPFVYAHSREAYENTIAYFKQEGLLDSVPYALVDSGWVGSLQKTLQQLLCYAGKKKELEGFYFGLYELPKGVKKEKYYTYYFSPTKGIKKKVYFSNCLYEAVYSAPHGMTVAYKNTEKGYEPVFYKEHNLNQIQMKQMEVWLKNFLSTYQKEDNFKNKKEIVFLLLKKLMGQPIREEVEVYGTLLFSDDVTEEHTQEIARKLSEQEIKDQYVWNKILIMLGLKKQTLKESAWIEGSIALNGKQTWWAIRWYKYLLYIRKWLKRGISFWRNNK